MPVESMSVRFLIGMVQLFTTPVMRSDRSISAISASWVIPGRHCPGGLRFTVVSTIEIGAQSVAISRDGLRVVSGGWGRSVAVWSVGPSFDDSARREIDEQVLGAAPSIAALAAMTNPVCEDTVAVSPGGSYAVAVSDGAVTRLCATGDGGSQVAVARLNPDAGDVTAAAVDDDGRPQAGLDRLDPTLEERLLLARRRVVRVLL